MLLAVKETLWLWCIGFPGPASMVWSTTSLSGRCRLTLGTVNFIPCWIFPLQILEWTDWHIRTHIHAHTHTHRYRERQTNRQTLCKFRQNCRISVLYAYHSYKWLPCCWIYYQFRCFVLKYGYKTRLLLFFGICRVYQKILHQKVLFVLVLAKSIAAIQKTSCRSLSTWPGAYLPAFLSVFLFVCLPVFLASFCSELAQQTRNFVSPFITYWLVYRVPVCVYVHVCVCMCVSERVGWVPADTEVPEAVKSSYKWIEGLSVTEMEIMHGAYRKDNPNGTFCLLLCEICVCLLLWYPWRLSHFSSFVMNKHITKTNAVVKKWKNILFVMSKL